LAEKMKDAIGDLIGKDEAQGYANRFLGVREIERMHGELLSSPEGETLAKLRTLDEAAGHVRAVAAHLRVAG
jgi:hypothetical protein